MPAKNLSAISKIPYIYFFLLVFCASPNSEALYEETDDVKSSTEVTLIQSDENPTTTTTAAPVTTASPKVEQPNLSYEDTVDKDAFMTRFKITDAKSSKPKRE